MPSVENTKVFGTKASDPSFFVELNEQIFNVCFSASELSQNLILISFDKEILVAQVDLQELSGIKELAKFNHGKRCTALCFSPLTTVCSLPKKLIFCAAGNDFKLRIFESDLSQSDTSKVITAHSSYINDISFDPDNSFLVSVSDDNTAKLWNAKDYSFIYKFKLRSPGISCCWHKEDNSKLMIAEKNGIIRFYNVNTQKPILSIDCNKPIMSAHWAPSDSQMIGCLQQSELVIWDLTRPSHPVYSKLLYTDVANSIKFSPLSELVATVSHLEGVLKVNHVQTQHQRLSNPITLASNISWHSRLPYVCVASDNKLMFWKVT